MIRRRTIWLLPLLASLCSLVRAAPSSQPASSTQSNAQVSLDLVTEEGQQQIRATVVSGGKPIENATVSFGVKRTFGTLVIGEDKTLDDGTAAVKFPADLPGGPDGVLIVTAQATPPGTNVPVYAEAKLSGAAKVALPSQPLPRALWAPHAPLELIIPIVLLLLGVWSTYAFAVAQIIAIRRGAKQ